MIGDVLTTSVLFEALRKKYPTAQLDYLIQPHTFPVVENNPFIDSVLFDKQDFEGNAIGFFRFSKHLKNRNYDVVIDVYSKLGTALLAARSGAKVRIGYKKWYTKFAYTHTFKNSRKPKTPAGVAIENRLKLLQPLANDFPKELKPKIFLTEKETEEAKQFLKAHGISENQKSIMISLLGSSEAKTYPLPWMSTLVDAIAARINVPILLNYMPKQHALVSEFLSHCKAETKQQIKADVYAKDLRKFLGVLSQCSAIIGNEGGAVNMGKALGLPSFSIYAPTTRREAWDSYPSPTQVAVHVKDFKPQLFKRKDKKTIKKEALHLYKEFEPNFILPKLKTFLKNIQ